MRIDEQEIRIEPTGGPGALWHEEESWTVLPDVASSTAIVISLPASAITPDASVPVTEHSAVRAWIHHLHAPARFVGPAYGTVRVVGLDGGVLRLDCDLRRPCGDHEV